MFFINYKKESGGTRYEKGLDMKIVGKIKEGIKVNGYKLSTGKVVSKDDRRA